MDVADVAVSVADEAADVGGPAGAALVPLTVIDYNKRNRQMLCVNVFVHVEYINIL